MKRLAPIYVVAAAIFGWIIGSSANLPFQGHQRNGSGTGDAVADQVQKVVGILKASNSGADLKGNRLESLYASAVRGAVFTLRDPYSSFLNHGEWDVLRQSATGSSEGIGAEIDVEGGKMVLRRILEGSPAARAGLHSGDTVNAIWASDHKEPLKKFTSPFGRSAREWTSLLFGPAGTILQIEVTSVGATRSIRYSIPRERVETPSVRSKMENQGDGIGRVVISEFSEKTTAQLDRAIGQLNSQGMKGLVLDLRFNPGGLLESAIEVAGRFAGNRTVVQIREKNGQMQKVTSRTKGGNSIPSAVVVLINQQSASASEIVAGAIQDYHVGPIVGKRSYGKGVVQTLYPLSDGSALRLTTAKYFTPNGRDIGNRHDVDGRVLIGTGGIEPDIETNGQPGMSEDQLLSGKEDPQLKQAIETLRTSLGLKSATARHIK